jgi:beta-lactamase class A
MTVEALCKAAIELSDNTAANLLLTSIGGPSALTSFWRAHGDSVSRLDRTEPALNSAQTADLRDTTTPAAMAGNLRRFVLGPVLSKASRERLTDWMLGCKTGDKRLRAGLPKDWLIGDKTGNNGKDAAGDIAVAWPKPGVPILVCAYIQGGSPTEEQIDTVFLRLGRMAGGALG